MPLNETVTINNLDKKLTDFAGAALQAVTGEMVTDIASKTVKMVEMADDLLQPETIDLLMTLPQVSKSLESTLLEVKRLEESGVLSSLIQIADLISSLKGAMTGSMVNDMAEKAISAVEIADTFVQKGTIELAEGMIGAFENAQLDQKGKEPMSILQLSKALLNKETRKGLSLLVSFIQHLPHELSRKI